jgi:hypothetical protein
MTDGEYAELLSALARKHLKHPGVEWPQKNIAILICPRRGPSASTTSSSVCANSVRHAAAAMEASGILPALDDASELVFAQFRRAAIPREHLEFLLNAGFTQAEVDVLLAIAVNTAAKVASRVPSATALWLQIVLMDASWRVFPARIIVHVNDLITSPNRIGQATK